VYTCCICLRDFPNVCLNAYRFVLHKGVLANTHTHPPTLPPIDTQRQRQRQRQRQKQRQRQSETPTHKHRHTHRYRHRIRRKYRHRHTQTHTQTHKYDHTRTHTRSHARRQHRLPNIPSITRQASGVHKRTAATTCDSRFVYRCVSAWRQGCLSLRLATDFVLHTADALGFYIAQKSQEASVPSASPTNFL